MATLLAKSLGKTSSYNYPVDDLDHIWKLLCLNQFHDCLPGSAIGLAYKDVHKVHIMLDDVLSQMTNDCFVALTSIIVRSFRMRYPFDIRHKQRSCKCKAKRRPSPMTMKVTYIHNWPLRNPCTLSDDNAMFVSRHGGLQYASLDTCRGGHCPCKGNIVDWATMDSEWTWIRHWYVHTSFLVKLYC